MTLFFRGYHWLADEPHLQGSHHRLGPLPLQLLPALGAPDEVRLDEGPLREWDLTRDEERERPPHVLTLHLPPSSTSRTRCKALR